VTTLAERLGYGPDDKLLIINCDDLGSSHSANDAIYDALRDGIATSATLMVPCPWSREAAARYRGEDVGVHLTLTSEWDLYRWGPVTHAPSLLDGDGGFPRTIQEVWDHADLDETRRELRTQIERAIVWGFDVTHLDSHMGTVQLRPEFFDIYLELAVEFGLPMRMPSSSAERVIGFQGRRLAEEEGVVFPDYFVQMPGMGSRKALEKILYNARAGVTELLAHPAVDSGELRSSHPDWPNRVDDHFLLVHDRDIRSMIERAGVTLIGYRELRELQRAAA